ncbi:MAG: YggS family pyridoxal phosphate-dependent enzyme [Burkholderiales bacterium]|nr:YggS family pyridoxal phosphate-dependent enzyme [Burkholderiales bacterium]
MGTIAAALQAVRERIAKACAAAGREPGEVMLLAVSKTFPAQAVRAAWLAGQRAFAESYVQEALVKQTELSELAIEWHYIGPLQRNKTRPVAERFAWVHSVDRLELAERLSRQRPPGLPPLQVCVQVNVAAEPSKRGVHPDEALALAWQISRLPALRLRGFMTIPPVSQETEVQRAHFRVLAQLLAQARAQGLELDTLSMGMSQDLEAAIAEGATIVRVGTAIFGTRPAKDKQMAARSA